MKTKTERAPAIRNRKASKRVGTGALVGRPKRKTAEQRQAGRFIELAGIVHYLLSQQRCPVIFEGRLAFVRVPGVSKEAFKQAIERLVVENLVAYCKDNPPNGKVITHAGPPNIEMSRRPTGGGSNTELP